MRRPQARSEVARRDPAAVVDLIAARADAKGSWKVSATEVRDALGVEPLEFYRLMYAAATTDRSVLGLGDITGSWSEENPESLLTALEVFCGPDAEQQLAASGVFFPHASRLDIIETFLSTTAAALAAHSYDRGEVSAMLRSLKGYEAARAAYLARHFPLSQLVQQAVEEYCRLRRFGIPAVARANVRRLIELYFRRHLLSEEALFADLSRRLFAQAVEEGYVAGRQERGLAAAEPDTLEAARRTLGVAGLGLSRELLRDRYRRLMKRFHPDVNPAGLEKAKEINAAYSRLLAALP